MDTIPDWVRRADANTGRRPDLPSTADSEELAKPRRENRRLRQERGILAKAAWFARDKTPSGSSSS